MIENYSAFRVLGAFSQKDWKSFLSFVKSPTHNSNAKVAALAKCLYDFSSFQQEGPFPNADDIGRLINNGSKLKPVTLRNYFSDLSKIAYEFLVYDWIRRHKAQHSLILLEALLQKRLFVDADKLLAGSPDPSGTTPSFIRFRMQAAAFELASEMDQRDSGIHVASIIQELDAFYLIERMKWAVEWQIFKRGKRHEGVEPAIDPGPLIRPELASSPDPAIRLAWLAYELFHNETHSGSLFARFRSMLESHFHEISNENAFSFSLMAQNYCSFQVNNGRTEFVRIQFDLLRQGIENGILMQDEKIPAWIYKNVATLGLALDEINWTVEFVEKNRKRIQSQYQNDVYHFCLANCYYYLKQFDQAFKLIYKVSRKSDAFLHIDCRTLELKLMLERRQPEDEEALFPFIKAFEVFLGRERALTYERKMQHQNKLKILRKILRLKAGNQKLRSKLLAEIKSTEHLADRHWLERLISD